LIPVAVRTESRACLGPNATFTAIVHALRTGAPARNRRHPSSHVPDDEPFPRDPGQEDAFEAMWKTRDSHLKSVPGFVSFHLMRGEVDGDARLYASHTLWADRTPFSPGRNPRRSGTAHKGCKPSEAMYDGPPVLECFDSVQAIEAE
jgi:heme-degrading monooxygenase HmoA